MIVKLVCTNTDCNNAIYYPQSLDDSLKKCNYMINRSGVLYDIVKQQPTNKIELFVDCSIVLIGGKTQGVELFEQAFTGQQIERLRYLSMFGISEYIVDMKNVNKDIKHLNLI